MEYQVPQNVKPLLEQEQTKKIPGKAPETIKSNNPLPQSTQSSTTIHRQTFYYHSIYFADSCHHILLQHSIQTRFQNEFSASSI